MALTFYMLFFASFIYAQPYEYVLASNSACFKARVYDQSTIIQSPKDGILAGVKLIFESGGNLRCGLSSRGVGPSNWGCDNENAQGETNIRSYTFFLKIVDEANYYGELLYPIHNETEGMDVLLPGTEYDFSQCLGNYGCIYGSYYLNDGMSANDAENITFINPRYEISKNDTFWLQYSEGCCQAATISDDNSGQTCAIVYFIYS